MAPILFQGNFSQRPYGISKSAIRGCWTSGSWIWISDPALGSQDAKNLDLDPRNLDFRISGSSAWISGSWT